MKYLLMLPIRFYRKCISPLFPPCCRYYPTCSAYAMQAMCAGKAVLCEKPVGISHSQAEQLEQCAKENGVYFAEAMWTWFNETAYKIKEWVDNKEVGKIKKVKSR